MDGCLFDWVLELIQVVKRQTCISVLGTTPAAAAAPGSVSDSQSLVSSSSADPGLQHSRSSVVEVAQTEIVLS